MIDLEGNQILYHFVNQIIKAFKKIGNICDIQFQFVKIFFDNIYNQSD